MIDGRTVRPLGSKVLLKRLPAEDTTRGGIIIPDVAKERPHQGIVEAVGPGRVLANGRRVELSVKKGDRVLYGRYASGTAVESMLSNRDPLFLVDEEEIHAVLEEG